MVLPLIVIVLALVLSGTLLKLLRGVSRVVAVVATVLLAGFIVWLIRNDLPIGYKLLGHILVALLAYVTISAFAGWILKRQRQR